MATVIDSLVVLLGLDASNYKKGRETAEKETKETARKSKAAADDITKSLVDVGRQVAVLMLGFDSAIGFGKWLGALNAGEAALGRTAANIGMSAHELNKWGNAVELAGGSATDAQAAFSQLTEDFQKMNTTGEQSQLLQFLRARSVNIRDANGNLRDQGQIFEELADKTAQYGRQYQVTMFKQAGLSQGYINYLVQQRDIREEQLRTAERDNDVTDETVKKAAELQQYWRNVGLQISAAGQMILTAITPMLTQVLKIFGDVNAESEEFTTGLKLIGSAAVVIKNLFVGMGNAIGGAAAAIGAALHGDFKGAARILDDQHANAQARSDQMGADLNDIWESKGNTAAKQAAVVARAGGDVDAQNVQYRNNNPGNVHASAPGQQVDARGIRVFGSKEEGLKALDADITTKMARGLDTISKIINVYAPAGDHNNVPAYIAALVKDTGKGANEHLTAADRAALEAAIIKHEGAQYGPTPGARRVAGSDVQAPGNSTTMSIGTIQVNAPNADPKAVADQVPAAIQRKFSISQSDTGQS
jgi:hypothetical protein